MVEIAGDIDIGPFGLLFNTQLSVV